MIEPLDGFVPAKWKPEEKRDRERCSAALHHMRQAWRLVEDAGKSAELKAEFMALALKVKAATGGREKDGFGEHVPPVVGRPKGIA